MYREEAIEWLKGYQLHFLKKRFGENYKSKLAVNDPENFSLAIDKYIDSKSELSDDEKIDIEIEMKNMAFSSEVLHTEYESESDHRILKTIADKYISLNPTQKNEKNLYIGTTLSNEINAEIIPKPELKATFILFDGELMIASLIISKIISQSLPFKNEFPHLMFPIKDSELYANLVENKTTLDRTVLGLYCCLFHRPGNSPQYFSESELQEYISLLLIESIELFIFSHEMGHYLHGDLTNTEEKPELRGEMKTEWHEEHFADLHGLNQIVKLYQENGQFLSLLGPEIFFNFLILREKLKPEYAVFDSHPPSSQRLSYYRICLSNFLSDDEQIAFLPFQEIIDLLFKYYHKLLTTTIANLEAFKQTQEYKDLVRPKE